MQAAGASPRPGPDGRFSWTGTPGCDQHRRRGRPPERAGGVRRARAPGIPRAGDVPLQEPCRTADLPDTPEFAEQAAPLAANQGLYNGFLAAGLVWSLLASEPLAGPLRLFFLVCVLVAAVFGAATVSRRILVIQGLPAALALAASLTA